MAQERVYPLSHNPAIHKEQKHIKASELNQLDSTFVYDFENLELKYAWDDFSVNKFEPFDEDYEADGVSSELFYHLMNETNTAPQDPEIIFCDSAYAHHDTIKVNDIGEVETVTHYPFAEHSVWVNDLDFYPVVGGLRTLFDECYVLVDSIIEGVLDPDQDTIWYNTTSGPGFIQDSARVFTKVVSDTNILWTDNFVYHNYTFAYQPWSLGVATFDGVDANGTPYAFGDDDAYGVADYLTSRVIDMSEVEDGESVYLTFLYQAEGFGNTPDTFDSLLVEFWNPIDEVWNTQYLDWQGFPIGIPDSTEPDQWDTARVKILEGFYESTDEFQFRFKNYASLSGALDHWHIDYVSLEIDVTPEIETFSDLAVSYPLNTLLQDYTAVPWDHYKNTTGNEKMRTDFDLPVFNSDNTNTNFSLGKWEVRNEGALEGEFDILGTGGPDAGAYLVGFNDCVIPTDPGFFYDQTVGGIQAAFDVQANIAAAVDISNKFNVNDTTRFTQRFDNYYAYDDGSAEAAYGIEGEGAQMAYKFEAYEAGRLKGILMHFVPSVTDFSSSIFLLTVWNDNDGQPGDIIYQDNFFQSHTVDYSGAINGFKYFEFFNMEYLNAEDTSLTVDEVFYVGWRNVDSPSLNIGLDWNIDNGDKVFRNVTGEWLTSSLEMSLMIRPVFSTALDGTLSEEEITENAGDDIRLYPNPATEQITISGLNGNYELRIFDMQGRMVTYSQNEHIVNVGNLVEGVYMVDVRDEFGEIVYGTKLIKQ